MSSDNGIILNLKDLTVTYYQGEGGDKPIRCGSLEDAIKVAKTQYHNFHNLKAYMNNWFDFEDRYHLHPYNNHSNSYMNMNRVASKYSPQLYSTIYSIRTKYTQKR